MKCNDRHAWPCKNEACILFDKENRRQSSLGIQGGEDYTDLATWNRYIDLGVCLVGLRFCCIQVYGMSKMGLSRYQVEKTLGGHGKNFCVYWAFNLGVTCFFHCQAMQILLSLVTMGLFMCCPYSH